MALPESIPTSYLRQVPVQGTGGRTLFDIAEDVYNGRVRLAVAGGQDVAPAGRTPQVEVEGRTVTVTVTV
jgi:hypothetical protein